MESLDRWGHHWVQVVLADWPRWAARQDGVVCSQAGSGIVGYGPATVMLALLESILPQLVQTALSALQSVVGLSAMVTAPAPVGCTVSSHRVLGAVLSPVRAPYLGDVAVCECEDVVPDVHEPKGGLDAEIELERERGIEAAVAGRHGRGVEMTLERYDRNVQAGAGQALG